MGELKSRSGRSDVSHTLAQPIRRLRLPGTSLVPDPMARPKRVAWRAQTLKSLRISGIEISTSRESRLAELAYTLLVLQWRRPKTLLHTASFATAQLRSRTAPVAAPLSTAPPRAKKQTGSLTSLIATLKWRTSHPPGLTNIVCARTAPNMKGA